VRLSGSWWVYFAIIVPNINLLKYKCNFSQAAACCTLPGVVDKFLTWTGVAQAQVGRNMSGAGQLSSVYGGAGVSPKPSGHGGNSVMIKSSGNSLNVA